MILMSFHDYFYRKYRQFPMLPIPVFAARARAAWKRHEATVLLTPSEFDRLR